MRGEKANDIRALVIYTKTIPAHPADFADFPGGLHPDIRAYLASHNIPCLYTHQAELFEYFGLREALHPVSAGYAEDERLAMDFLEKMCAFCRRMGDGGSGPGKADDAPCLEGA